MHKIYIKKGQQGLNTSALISNLSTPNTGYYPWMSTMQRLPIMYQYTQPQQYSFTPNMNYQNYIKQSQNNTEKFNIFDNQNFTSSISNALGQSMDAIAQSSSSPWVKGITTGIGRVGQQLINNLGSSTTQGKEGLKNLTSTNGFNIANLGGTALSVANQFAPQKREYSGDKGELTKNLDAAYDNLSDAISTVPGFGTAASLIMKGGALAGKFINKWGGGTDGMCVCAGTKVFTNKGELKNIEDLNQKDGIIGWSEKTKEILPQKIHNVITTAEKECLEITLKSGEILRCSVDHPILSHTKERAESHTINGKRIAYRNWAFNRADSLQIGNYVGLANNIDFWGDFDLNDAYLVGLLIGDGSYTQGNSCRLTTADPDTWEYIESNNLGVINNCNGKNPDKYSKEVRTYRIINGMDLMRCLGIVYQHNDSKTLPKNIGTFNKQSVCKLLAGLYDTDGSVNCVNGKVEIVLYQSNLNLLKEVKLQLHKLGIFGTINARPAKDYQIGGRLVHSKKSYRLCVNSKKSVINFYNNIKLNISYKQQHLQECYDVSVLKKDQEHNIISGAKQSKIIDIKHIGKQLVYNLQADFDHTYLANGIITHNTNTDAILGSSFLNLTPLGLINGFGGKKANKFGYNTIKDQQERNYIGGDYNFSTIDDAARKSGKKYGLFSSGARRSANKQIAKGNSMAETLKNISQTANFRNTFGNAMTDVNSVKYQNRISGNIPGMTPIGKKGMKIEKQTEEEFIILDISKFKPIIATEEEVQKFKEGGSFNIIPDGALHARKNNMDIENITKKGIPVVDKDGVQQAEIERDEIIFRKEVTDAIEEARKDGSDKKAIEIGKLLVKEIFHNTQDNTGLIKDLTNETSTIKEQVENHEVFPVEKKQQGGQLNKPKYIDWIKTVPQERLSPNYDLEGAYNNLPFEELESWRKASEEDLQQGKFHLRSIYELPNGEYKFLKLGKEETNPEVKLETDMYRNNKTGLENTHDLIYDGDRYYYRFKKNLPKRENGGLIDQIHNMDLTKLNSIEKDTLLQLLLQKASL